MCCEVFRRGGIKIMIFFMYGSYACWWEGVEGCVRLNLGWGVRGDDRAFWGQKSPWKRVNTPPIGGDIINAKKIIFAAQPRTKREPLSPQRGESVLWRHKHFGFPNYPTTHHQPPNPLGLPSQRRGIIGGYSPLLPPPWAHLTPV